MMIEIKVAEFFGFREFLTSHYCSRPTSHGEIKWSTVRDLSKIWDLATILQFSNKILNLSMTLDLSKTLNLSKI
jgi:hypothetical protein